MAPIRVHQARDEDRAALTALHEREWGGPVVVVHDTRYDLRDLHTLVAVDDTGMFAGALAYRVDADGPTIPHVGADGIPLHDELRLSRHLTGADQR
ncbi:hypothetical protein [Micromonospora sp. DT31]|uniref:hypothetical protein n=1 Tax=Micromonospora sp. DT31 TaxID=3393434 RepID=UPI003CE8114B